MRTFYVLWTYIANYSRLMKVSAKDATEAAESAMFGPGFDEKATVYVFDVPPAMIVYKGQKFPRVEASFTLRKEVSEDNSNVDAYREASRNDR